MYTSASKGKNKGKGKEMKDSMYIFLGWSSLPCHYAVQELNHIILSA